MTWRGKSATSTSSRTLKAQKRGKIVQPRRYYQDSYHLCYELLGQRNDITEITAAPTRRPC